MPDLGQLALLVLIGVPLAVVVSRPLLRVEWAPDADSGHDLDALALRRRIAYEALRDLEVDHRAGNLHVRQYLRMRSELELRAAAALADLENAAGHPAFDGSVPETHAWRAGRRLSAGIGTALAVVLLVGFALPQPVSLANRTVVNEPLAAARAAEEARTNEIERLLRELQTAEEPDPETLSKLADAYLAGNAQEDLRRAALALLALIQLRPDDSDPRARIVTAYLRAGDYENAAKATDALEAIAPESVDVAFFRGLIALRGTRDQAAAVEAFDEFLRAAPDDPRAAMVRSLRAEATGEVPPGS